MSSEWELVGERIELRELRTDDVDDVLQVIGDERVTASLSFDVRNRGEVESMLAGAVQRQSDVPRREYYLAVTAAGRDNCIGFARLGLDGVRAAKLGYAIAHDQWGKGYGFDAARTLTGFGFERLGLHRVSAAMGPDNSASIALAERLGMSCEGRIRHHVFTNNNWRDSLLYSVLEDEWSGPPPRRHGD